MSDVLNKPCIGLARNAYRFGEAAGDSRSAHSFLWIYMSLSTSGIQRAPLSASQLHRQGRERGQGSDQAGRWCVSATS